MRNPPTVVRLFLLVALLAALSGCSPAPTPVVPTLDPAVIRTQAAATIYARLTADAPPTATPTAPPTATATPLPPTATLAPTATLGTPVPTLTPSVTATEPIVGEAARCLGTAPHSGAQIRPNEIYNLEFDLLNIGTTTWTTGYRLVYVAGEPFTNVRAIQLDRAVPPGEKGIFILGTFGSEDMNPHYTYWQLYNDKGIAVDGGYCEFWYQPV